MKTSENRNIWTRLPFIILMATICCFLWGSAFPCIKNGYKLFSISSTSTPSQILFAGIRFAFAGLMVILAGSLIEKKFLLPSRKSIFKILLLSVFQTVGQYVFFYIGLAHTSGVNASIIESANTFFTILWAAVIFHTETISFFKIAGCALGFAGVCLIELHGADIQNLSFNIAGDGSILVSALLASFVPSLLKKYSSAESPFVLSGYQFFVGGVAMVAVSLVTGGTLSMPESPVAAFSLLSYMAFISACAYTLWTLLMKYNDVSKVAVFGFINPVFGFMLSAVFLGETGTAFSWVGMVSLVLVCAGIVLVNCRAEK